MDGENIAKKLATIADNVQSVYDAGVEAGKSQGHETGYDEGYENGYNDGMEAKETDILGGAW